jgi:hypothetical protein
MGAGFRECSSLALCVPVSGLEFAAKCDGKDYPFTGSPDIDTVAFRKIDANTFEIVFKKAAKEVI